MEKCTYCVQRISAARIQAQEQGRAIKDGEVVTACQQACPTQAITFGNLNDPDSAVAERQGEPAQLHAAGRAQHPAAHLLSRRDPAGVRTSRRRREGAMAASHPTSLVGAGVTYQSVTADITAVPLGRSGPRLVDRLRR